MSVSLKTRSLRPAPTNQLIAMPGGISISCLLHCWLMLASPLPYQAQTWQLMER
jgi:hypothetical protein